MCIRRQVRDGAALKAGVFHILLGDEGGGEEGYRSEANRNQSRDGATALGAEVD